MCFVGLCDQISHKFDIVISFLVLTVPYSSHQSPESGVRGDAGDTDTIRSILIDLGIIVSVSSSHRF